MVCCAAYGCKNRSEKARGVTFHKFPRNAEILEKWVQAIRRKNWTPTSSSRLCSSHFRPEDIDRTSLCVVRLRENVVPCIFPTNPEYLRKLRKNGRPPKHIRNEPMTNENEEQTIIGSPTKETTLVEISTKSTIASTNCIMNTDSESEKIMEPKEAIVDKLKEPNFIINDHNYTALSLLDYPLAADELKIATNYTEIFSKTSKSMDETNESSSATAECFDQVNETASNVCSKHEIPVKLYMLVAPENCHLSSSECNNPKNPSEELQTPYIVLGTAIKVFETPCNGKEVDEFDIERQEMITEVRETVSKARATLGNSIKIVGTEIKIVESTVELLGGARSSLDDHVETHKVKMASKSVLNESKSFPQHQTNSNFVEMDTKLTYLVLKRKYDELRDTNVNIRKKIKILHQMTRRQNKKIEDQKTLIEKLEGKVRDSMDYKDILQDIHGPNKELLTRLLSKSKGTTAPTSFSPELRNFASTLYAMCPDAYKYARSFFNSCLPHPTTLSKWHQEDPCVQKVQDEIDGESVVKLVPIESVVEMTI